MKELKNSSHSVTVQPSECPRAMLDSCVSGGASINEPTVLPGESKDSKHNYLYYIIIIIVNNYVTGLSI